ncbi:glycosyl transferase family 2 [Candidatus Protofrankia datiscae]|uniref:Glycosyl transferase family 2 n=1 Tax=Candidatus Protofrankia datiscae TaxID=2716812 RepID=F8AZC0_9ACTN|nr:glycosyl transferase family 2 [Candidatus Protofrankia datiscae]
MNLNQALAAPPSLHAFLTRMPGQLRFITAGGTSIAARVALMAFIGCFFGAWGRAGYGFSVVAATGLLWGLDRGFTWRGHDGGRLRPAIARVSTESVGWLLFTALTELAANSSPTGQAGPRNLLAAAVCALVVVSAHLLMYSWFVFGSTLTAASVRVLHGVLLLPAWPLFVETAQALYRGRDNVAIGIWTVVSLSMLLIAGLTLVRAQYGWQLPDRVDHVDLEDQASPGYTFSLIVPARQEPVLGRTLTQLLAGDYPPHLFELVVVVSDDELDRETREVAQEFAGRYPNVRIVTPSGAQRSKPLSLEDARKHCHGELIGIVDAESLIARGLLGYVNTLAVRHPETGIFQGGVQLMNVRGPRWRRPESAGMLRALVDWADSGTSWWRARNCLEYYIWFMSRLRYQAKARFIPLGGNTVFVRREVLDRLGGWDVSCLTEDCDLGVRASVAGVTTTVFYHPELTTQEETPESLKKLVVQRTRWMMGFIQVFRKGDWRRLPGWRQRVLAAEMLLMPFFQAMAGLVLPTSMLLTFFLSAPVGIVIIFWLPLLAMLMLTLTEEAAFREFADAYRIRVTPLDSARLIASAPVYQLVLSLAALRAVVRLFQRKLEWEKTTHVGAHHVVIPGPAQPALRNHREPVLRPGTPVASVFPAAAEAFTGSEVLAGSRIPAGSGIAATSGVSAGLAKPIGERRKPIGEVRQPVRQLREAQVPEQLTGQRRGDRVFTPPGVQFPEPFEGAL